MFKFSASTLFKDRLSAHIKELSRYLRYILNGHTAIAMVFLITVLSVYYQQWLAQLSPDFPAAIIIALLFALLMTYTPINTLLKKPDLVFLTVSEDHMSAYFKRAILYSYVLQLYIVFLVSAALGPMYFHAFPERNGKVYLLTIVVLLVLKLCNTSTHWVMLQVRNSRLRLADQMIRFIIGLGLFYFLINSYYIFASILTILLFILFFFNYRNARRNIGVNWELLVERDLSRMQFFYRMASMFVDVPHLQSRIRRRRALTALVNKLIPFKQGNTYNYLYKLTFLRSGDYLQMYVRLTLIGGLLIYFIPNDLLKIAFAVLFIYMSNFQVISLYHHHRVIVWLDLYPLESKVRVDAFLSLTVRLTIVQTLIFSFLFLIQLNVLYTVLTLVIGSLFNILFNYKYVKNRLVKDI